MKKIFLYVSFCGAVNLCAQQPQMVSDITSPNEGTGLTLHNAVSFNGKLYFSATGGTDHGRELWVYDGVNHPSLVYNLNPGQGDGANGMSGPVSYACVFNNKIYFSGNNGSHGFEPCMYDGINPPVLAAEVVPGAAGSSPFRFAAIGGHLYFTANAPGTGEELYVYDGTNPPELHNIAAGSESSSPDNFIALGNKIYFSAETDGAGRELCVYDPITETVTVATDIVAGTSSSAPGMAVLYNDKLYFSAQTDAFGRELYSFDGTLATRVTDVGPGNAFGIQGPPCVYKDHLYFAGIVSIGENQLYRYNPSNNIAALVYQVNVNGNATIDNFIRYGDNLYFTANDGQHGSELWVHDGINTNMVADLNPGASGSFIRDLIVHDNVLYFSAFNGVDGEELYSFTDPEAGIQNLKLNGDITLAPNPAILDTYLHIRLSEPAELAIRLVDGSGKTVWEKAKTPYILGHTSVLLPAAQLATGVYFYAVTDYTGKTLASGKLVKQ